MSNAKKIAFSGVLVALAFGLSWLEMLIPLDSLGVPGVKIGLANLAVMAAIYLFGFRFALCVSLARIALSWLIFGGFTAFLYSLAGGMLSLCVMWLLVRSSLFGEAGVSVSGAVTHNVGQLAVAAVLLRSGAVFSYLPVLTLAALAAGTLNGFLLHALLPPLKRILKV